MCFNLNITGSIVFLFPKLIDFFEFFLIIDHLFAVNLSSVIIAVSVPDLALASGPTRTVLDERRSAAVQADDNVLAIQVVVKFRI